jgi:hypothetical protein
LQVADERPELRVERALLTDNDQIHGARRRAPSRAVRRAQPATEPIPVDGPVDLAAHSEAHAPGVAHFPPQHKERRPIDPPAPVEERLKFGASGQPLAAGKSAR